jgi:hypothetical protein
VSERFHRRTSPRRESCPNRVEADLAGLRVPLIGFDEVLAHKRAAGRPKDAGDVDALERAAKRQGRS